MCGIVCGISHNDIADDVVEGLKNLNYRGYDSWGLYYPKSKQRDVGLGAIEKEECITSGTAVMGHVRWATTGAPTLRNAHPIQRHEYAIVMNGVITNYKELVYKEENWVSDTDAERLLLHWLSGESWDEVKGDFACVISTGHSLVAYCRNYPLYIGKRPVISHALDGHMIASDITGLVGCTGYFKIQNDTTVDINENYITNLSKHTGPLLQQLVWTPIETKEEVDTSGSWMEKEIRDIPNIKVHFPSLACGGNHNIFVGIGTSYNMAKIIAGMYSGIALTPDDVVLCHDYSGAHLYVLSQSGETYDTLSLLRSSKIDTFEKVTILTNRENSTMESLFPNDVVQIGCGEEKGVLATKSAIAQLLAADAVMGYNESSLTIEDIERAKEGATLLVKDLTFRQGIWSPPTPIGFFGNGYLKGVAMEAALKWQESVYATVIGTSLSELKHGPLACVDKNFTAVVFDGPKWLKTDIGIEEIEARGGCVCLVAYNDKRSMMYNIMYQLVVVYWLALLAAEELGHDPDMPRNLAKSITVP